MNDWDSAAAVETRQGHEQREIRLARLCQYGIQRAPDAQMRLEVSVARGGK